MHIVERDRQAGILNTGMLRDTRIVLLGVGRGLGAAKTLAASGVGTIILIDPDVVERENVGQSAYEIADIGEAKVAAAKRHLVARNPSINVQTYKVRGEEVADLDEIMASADLIKIGVDDLASQFSLADNASSLGVDTIVCGTTGDNTQWFAALCAAGGKRLEQLLPDAYAGLQRGYRPPPFFPSCLLNAENLNGHVARLGLGLLHHRAGSTLSIADIGAAFVETPLVIGSNGIHAPSGFLTPTRFVEASPSAATQN